MRFVCGDARGLKSLFSVCAAAKNKPKPDLVTGERPRMGKLHQRYVNGPLVTRRHPAHEAASWKPPRRPPCGHQPLGGGAPHAERALRDLTCGVLLAPATAGRGPVHHCCTLGPRGRRPHIPMALGRLNRAAAALQHASHPPRHRPAGSLASPLQCRVFHDRHVRPQNGEH